MNTKFSPEPKIIEEELLALKELKKEILEIKDPQTGEILKFRPNPIFLSRQFNYFSRLEKLQ